MSSYEIERIRTLLDMYEVEADIIKRVSIGTSLSKAVNNLSLTESVPLLTIKIRNSDYQQFEKSFTDFQSFKEYFYSEQAFDDVKERLL